MCIYVNFKSTVLIFQHTIKFPPINLYLFFYFFWEKYYQINWLAVLDKFIWALLTFLYDIKSNRFVIIKLCYFSVTKSVRYYLILGKILLKFAQKVLKYKPFFNANVSYEQWNAIKIEEIKEFSWFSVTFNAKSKNRKTYFWIKRDIS